MKSRSKTILLHTGILLILLFSLALTSLLLYNKYQAIKIKKQEYIDKIRYYESIIDIESNWIVSNQVSSGALLFRKSATGESDIVPYFSNTAALALLNSSTALDYSQNVKKYMEWYLLHLNDADSDIDNGDGSIFNYKISHTDDLVVLETSTGRYDSVDSYAASFITLLRGYYEKTGDKDFLVSNRHDIQRVIIALLGTVDTDGLSMTNNSGRVKYTMDNAEVNKGLEDALFLTEEVFLKDPPDSRSEVSALEDLNTQIEDALLKNTEAFENLLWNGGAMRYEIGIGKNNELLNFIGWEIFYPDATAQMFPVAFGMIDPDSKRAELLYEKFCSEYNWENLEPLYDGSTGHYWCILAYSGAVMGDTEKVDKFLINYQKTVLKNHNDPMYIGDAGWCVLTCEKMISIYDEKINEIDPYGIVSADLS